MQHPLSSLKFVFKKPYLSQYLMDSNKQGLKIKLDRVKSKSSYILLIKVINFKLSLINYVHFFETPSGEFYDLLNDYVEFISTINYERAWYLK